MPFFQSPQRLSADRSAVLVIDLQEKLLPVIPAAESVVRQAERLVHAAMLLEIPCAATVQYPQGLGGLVQPIADLLPTAEEKLDFSAAVCRDSLDRWCDAGRDQIVIAGIEAHVCVMQTVLDLLAEGLRPYVVAEAVASRDTANHQMAIERMTASGATILPIESVLFEWLGTSKHPHFKAFSQMIKSR